MLGRSHRSENRAKELGAERFIATGEGDPAAELKSWGFGADLIVNSTPSTETASAMLGGLAPDGTVVLLGYGPQPIDQHDLMPDVTPVSLNEAPATLALMVDGDWHSGGAVITF